MILDADKIGSGLGTERVEKSGGKIMLNPDDVVAVVPSYSNSDWDSATEERGCEVLIRGCSQAIFINLSSAKMIEALERAKNQQVNIACLGNEVKPGMTPDAEYLAPCPCPACVEART